MSEITYVLLKPRKVGHEVRQPGELVPEAHNWSNRNAYINRGVITSIPVESLSSDHEEAFRAWQQAEAERLEAATEPASPEPSQPSQSPQRSLSEQVAEATVDEVKDRVIAGDWGAAEVWEVESGDKRRSTLLTWLEEQVAEE